MSKTIRNKFSSSITYECFYKAYLRASKGKTDRKEVIIYTLDLETNLANLMKEVSDGRYQIGKYRIFTIKEPKERLIKSLPFKDRIVHQWYVYEFIKPYIVPRFIKDTYACIDEKGTHKAVNVLQEYMKKMKKQYPNYYVIKCDVSKYFYNINRKKLFDILNKYIKDKKILELTRKFIYDDDNIIGIPIGNYTSQYFANIYLNELDYYIKYDLKIKYYVRYMDDFILLVEYKNEAKRVMSLIKQFLNEELLLDLNRKSRYYHNSMGINFCGYITFENYRMIRKSSKRKIIKKVRIWNYLKRINRLNVSKMHLQLSSWKGHISHANTFNLCKKIIGMIE